MNEAHEAGEAFEDDEKIAFVDTAGDEPSIFLSPKRLRRRTSGERSCARGILFRAADVRLRVHFPLFGVIALAAF